VPHSARHVLQTFPQLQPNRVGVDNLIDLKNKTLRDVTEMLELRYSQNVFYVCIQKTKAQSNHQTKKQTKPIIQLTLFSRFFTFDLYGNHVVSAYKHNLLIELSPHIFACAQYAFSSLLRNNKSQSIILRSVKPNQKHVIFQISCDLVPPTPIVR
jgi:myosin heavy subunit